MIAADATDAYRVLPGRSDAGLIVLCDHARNAFPAEYGTLGVAEDQLKRHIAYDIGVEAIAEMVSRQLGVPAILSCYSRLLIDPNRGADDPTLIMRLSDGAIVPGNRYLDDAEREKRTRLYFNPYHTAIDRVIDQCLATGVAPALLSLHSFTESWKGAPRPWHVGILWGRDPRLARPLLDAFYAEGDLIVGDNEPYVGVLKGDCLDQHAVARGLAGAIIEYRQDLVRDEAGQTAWAERTVRIVSAILAHAELGPRLRGAGGPAAAIEQVERLQVLHQSPEKES